jgi:hypothetical protein|tara:strand:+ start:39 stop:398 length:360 start_codon:yes stop_codon:yes gene_type:complete
MKRLALALASTFFAAPAFAGVYVNVESNAGYTGSDYESRTTDFHVGYEDTAGAVDWYVQGGPAVISVDGADNDNQMSGKLGANVAATEKLGFYGEISVVTADGDVDNSWGTKIGTKYSF